MIDSAANASQARRVILGSVAAVTPLSRALASPSRSTSRSRSSGLNGLVRNRSAPASSASRSTLSPCDGGQHHDRGVAGAPSSARSRRQASMPSRRGMSTSRNTIAGRSRRATSSASTPSAASWRSKSATSSSVVAISLRMNGSSSTTRTRAAHRISARDPLEWSSSSIDLNAATTRGSKWVPALGD